MYSKECIDLSSYRLSKAEQYLEDAKRTLELEMYDTSAKCVLSTGRTCNAERSRRMLTSNCNLI